MKKLIFACGIILFVFFMVACQNKQENGDVSEEEVAFYAIDPLDAKIAEIEKKNRDIFSVKGEEDIIETDSSFIRHCPVKFINEKTCDVKDTVFIIEEIYY